MKAELSLLLNLLINPQPLAVYPPNILLSVVLTNTIV